MPHGTADSEHIWKLFVFINYIFFFFFFMTVLFFKWFRINHLRTAISDDLLAKLGDRSTIMESGPDVEAPLTVIASSRNPFTNSWSHPEYTSATMRRACTTVQMFVDILRTQVRLYWPVAMSESMANDRHRENMKRVRCGMPDHKPICTRENRNN